MIPIRCFSCGGVIAHKWTSFQTDLQDGMTANDSMNRHGIKRLCCRRMFLGHVDTIDKQILYTLPPDRKKEE